MTNTTNASVLARVAQEVARDAFNFATYRRTCTFIMNSNALAEILGNTKDEYIDFTLNMIVTGANTDPLKLSEKQRQAIGRILQFNMRRLIDAYMQNENAQAEEVAAADSEVIY